MAIDGANVNRAILPALNAEVVNQPDNDRIQRVVESIYKGAIRNMVEGFGRKVVWAWNTTLDSLKADSVIVSLIFFSVFAAFGFTTALQAGIVYIICKFATVVWQDNGLQGGIELLERENLALRNRIRELIDQQEVQRGEVERTVWDRDQLRGRLERSNQDLVQARLEWENIVLQRAPLIIERDGLLESKQRLQDTNAEMIRQRVEEQNHNQRLVQERELAVREKDKAVEVLESQQERYQKAIHDVEVLTVRLKQAGGVKQLNELLSEFLRFIQDYRSIQGSQELLLCPRIERLIPLYKKNREELHDLLQGVIDSKNESSPERVILGGILDLSRDELRHLEGFSRVFNIFEYICNEQSGSLRNGSQNCRKLV